MEFTDVLQIYCVSTSDIGPIAHWNWKLDIIWRTWNMLISGNTLSRIGIARMTNPYSLLRRFAWCNARSPSSGFGNHASEVWSSSTPQVEQNLRQIRLNVEAALPRSERRYFVVFPKTLVTFAQSAVQRRIDISLTIWFARPGFQRRIGKVSSILAWSDGTECFQRSDTVINDNPTSSFHIDPQLSEFQGKSLLDEIESHFLQNTAQPRLTLCSLGYGGNGIMWESERSR
jgi:hypothetical protein